MKRLSWQIRLGLLLLALSAIVYLIHYAIFRDPHHIFLWSVTSFAFLPISVLFVTLIINQLLSRREKRARLEKLEMVIGAFFQ
jgi:membrane protein YdbS with pleckstrin-like domain